MLKQKPSSNTKTGVRQNILSQNNNTPDSHRPISRADRLLNLIFPNHSAEITSSSLDSSYEHSIPGIKASVPKDIIATPLPSLYTTSGHVRSDQISKY